MNIKEPKPPGFPWVSPIIMVKDVDSALDFYQKAFGFEVKRKVSNENGITVHVEVHYHGQLLLIDKAGEYGDTTVPPSISKVKCALSLYLYTENVEELYTRAIKEGAKSIMEPENAFWGDRHCRLADPDGYEWGFATHLS